MEAKSRTEFFSKEIAENTQAFREAFNGLNVQQLNWKPSSDTWSIGQVIDHLIVINSSYFPVIRELKEGSYRAPFIAKIGFLVNLFGNMILKSVQPEEKRKTRTLSIWKPSQSEIPGDILSRFTEHQSELQDIIMGTGELLDQGVVISSPANRNIVYKLDKAFEILVTHEKRHLLQAKNVLAMQESSNAA